MSASTGFSIKAKLVLGLTVLVVLLLPLAALGVRFQLWPYYEVFQRLTWVIYAEVTLVLISFILVIVALFRKHLRDVFALMLSIIIAGSVLLAISWHFERARALPAIHDITTDWVNPPQFVVIPKERPAEANSLVYGGESISQQQRVAYPQVKAILTFQSPGQAFGESLAIVRQNGWRIVAANEADGYIEATATTFWFGFKDDIVIRVTPDGSGSRIDLRSVSRVGRSDLGANAARIENFIDKYRQQEARAHRH